MENGCQPIQTTDLPVQLSERLQKQLGEKFPQFLAHLSTPLDLGIRFNPLKPLSNELQQRVLQEISPTTWQRVPWHDDAWFTTAIEAKPGLHAAHAAGAVYSQDPSAMAPAVALDPQPGERIIDLAAAPGGKTTQLAAAVGHTGTVYANEIDAGRAQALMQNVERLGAANTIVLSEPTRNLAKQWPGAFDRVMLDAPCSGEGMLKKHGMARVQWTQALVDKLAALQRTLLEDAAELVRPGGVICYSTCTFSPEENEELITAFLADHPEFSEEEPTFPTGFPTQRRFWPHEQPGEGQFLTLLRKSPDAEPSHIAKGPFNTHVCTNPSGPLAAAWKSFAHDVLTEEGHDWLEQFTLAEFRGKLLALPPKWLPAGRLRIVRGGITLGSMRGKRFVPHHATAAALPRGTVHNELILAGDALDSYRAGAPFAADGSDGAGVAYYGDASLGWFSRKRNEVRPLLPRGLRTV